MQVAEAVEEAAAALAGGRRAAAGAAGLAGGVAVAALAAAEGAASAAAAAVAALAAAGAVSAPAAAEGGAGAELRRKQGVSCVCASCWTGGAARDSVAGSRARAHVHQLACQLLDVVKSDVGRSLVHRTTGDD